MKLNGPIAKATGPFLFQRVMPTVAIDQGPDMAFALELRSINEPLAPIWKAWTWSLKSSVA